MPLAHQTDNVSRPVYYHCKQPRNVAAQNAHIERFRIGDPRELAAECHLASSLAKELDVSADDHRIDRSAQAAITSGSS